MKKNKLFMAILIVVLLIVAIFFYSKKKILKPQNKPNVENQEELNNSKVNWESSLEITKMLLPKINSEERVEDVTHVLLHFISDAVNDIENPYKIERIYSILDEYELSSHYVIDRDGTIYLLTPENRVAYHAGDGKVVDYPQYEDKLNHYSIGIELMAIGTQEEMSSMITQQQYNLINESLIGYTEEQYEAVNILLADILDRHKTIKVDRKHILGHDEYSEYKTDPGSLFDWNKIEL